MEMKISAQRIWKGIVSELWMGFNLFERIYMLSMLALQIGVFMWSPESVLGIVSGISGIISVVLCAKGKIGFYFIGFVQTLSYLYLAFENQFYGEVMENIFYLVTMVWGIFIWKKKMLKNEDGTSQIKAQAFNPKQWVVSPSLTGILTVGLGYALTLINSAQAYTDAATNILALFAQLLMIRGYREQWIWWLAINILCIKMWFVAGNWSMVAMYFAWIINCLYGWYTWSKLNKREV